MGKDKLGEAELEVLRFVSDRDGTTVREAAEHFAETRGLARTTVLTMMERLRKKGFLTREGDGGAFRYRSAQSKASVLRNLVGDFVERSLGGSLQPFVAYLADKKGVSQEEVEHLQALVDELERRDHGQD